MCEFSWDRGIYALVWIALIALYVGPPLAHLEMYLWNYDEGPQLQAAALAHAGYRLYDPIVLNKPPLLTWLMEMAFTLGGVNLLSARLLFLLLSLAGFVALGALAELWWGRGAGPAAMALWLMLPEVPVRAAVVMNDLPAMGAMLAALWAATRYRRSRRWGWLVGAGVAYAVTLMMHPLLIAGGIAVAWLVAAPSERYRWDVGRAALEVFLLGGVVAAMLLLMMLPLDWAGFWRWVYAYNAGTGEAAIINYSAWPRIARYLGEHALLVAVAVASAVLLTISRRRAMGPALLWAYLTAMTLLLLKPLWLHYRLLLLTPLVMIAGGGLAQAAREAARRPLRWMRVALGVLVVLGAGVMGWLRWQQPLTWPTWPEAGGAVWDRVRKEAPPGAIVASDNPFWTFAEGYLVPPTLADTSLKRLTQGDLHPGEVLAAIEPGASLVMDAEDGRFTRFPAVMAGVRAMAAREFCEGDLCLYRVRDFEPAATRLGEAIALRGYRIEPELAAGQSLTVTLLWEAVAPIGEDVTVFVHLLDGEGELVAQHDGPPLSGLAPTRAWPVGALVADPHGIAAPSDLAPGAYTVGVGLYRRPSLTRLPAFSADGRRWPDDVVVLEAMEP